MHVSYWKGLIYFILLWINCFVVPKLTSNSLISDSCFTPIECFMVLEKYFNQCVLT